MSVFNPNILDASIHALTTSLRDEQKADVLLYASRYLPLEGTLVENAVQSCLQIPNLPPPVAARVRMLRVKARLAAGHRHGIHQELQAILTLDPEHSEAKAILFRTDPKPLKAVPTYSKGCPAFSSEVWRNILLFLPRRDLKTLLSVPHVVSRIASKLLFQDVSLHFGLRRANGAGGVRLDDVPESRNAEILSRIITDGKFACVVKTLRIYAPEDPDYSMSFQRGMLSNALPKLVALTNVHCRARWDDLNAIVRSISDHCPRIEGLSLNCLGPGGIIQFPRLKHITHFAYTTSSPHPSSPSPDAFLTQNRDTMRAVSLSGAGWTFSPRAVPIRHLAHLTFDGAFEHAHVLADVLRAGHQLESLNLTLTIAGPLASAFRAAADGGEQLLPLLKHFAFGVRAGPGGGPGAGGEQADRQLFPAVADFLRGRAKLRTLHLCPPRAGGAQLALGYDAAVWGVLPSLTGLRGLQIVLPADVAPGLAAWLLPRGLRALSLSGVVGADQRGVAFVSQLRPGIPPGLRFAALDPCLASPSPPPGAPPHGVPERAEDVQRLVDAGFPAARLVRLREHWTVRRGPGGGVRAVERWDARRSALHCREWMEWLGCEDGLWPELF